MTGSGTSELILARGVQALEAVASRTMGLDDWLDRRADPALRRSLSSLLFTFFRKKRAIDAVLATCWQKQPRPELIYLLELAVTMACFQSAIRPESAVNIAVDTAKRRLGPGAGKFTNAVLRRALPQIKTEMPPEELLPEVLARRWRKHFMPEEFGQLTGLFQGRFPAVVRWRSGFVPEPLPGVEPLALPWASDWTFGSCAHPEKILPLEPFTRGRIYFQDPAPALVTMMLEQAAIPATVRAVDLCAAPGGKLLLTAEFLAARNIAVTEFAAVDRSAARQKLTQENLTRCGVEAAVVTSDAASFHPADGQMFDLVLADVPCSNSGVFRRRPDALWRWSLPALTAMTGLQREILANAARLCAPGGILLYSTCSLEPEENQEQTTDFLRNHPGFRMIDQRLWLPQETHDGTFGALFRREA